jgi:hypothetical protein
MYSPGNGLEMSVDLSLLDVPRRQPVKDPQAYLQAAVQWHFSPETGARYWLERAKPLDFDPVTEVKTDDLARSPTSSASYATWLFGTWCREVRRPAGQWRMRRAARSAIRSAT